MERFNDNINIEKINGVDLYVERDTRFVKVNEGSNIYEIMIAGEIERINRIFEDTKINIKLTKYDFELWYLADDNTLCCRDDEQYSGRTMVVRKVQDIEFLSNWIQVYRPATESFDDPLNLGSNGMPLIKFSIPDFLLIDLLEFESFNQNEILDCPIWQNGKLMFGNTGDVDGNDNAFNYLEFSNWSEREFNSLLNSEEN